MCAPMYHSRVNFCNVLRWVAVSVAYGSVALHNSC